MGQIGILKL